MGCAPSKPAGQLEYGDERTERTYGAWAQAEENDEQDFLEAQKTAVTVQNKLQALHPEKHEAQELRKRQASMKGLGRRRVCALTTMRAATPRLACDVQ